ncbi:MAG: hypothetical protein J6D11_00710 [Clostridia bacterium]|nr:hypothetical protein [Clostridia bacterium]
MGIGYILAGLVFLFNPFINIIDIFPDFIGYLLILRGMSKMADIEYKLSQAKIKMTHALAVSLGRFGVMLLGFIAKFDNTLILVFVFSFAVLELFFVLPAFKALFEGLEYLELRFAPNGISKKAEDAAKITPIFLVVRSVCALLPELTALKTDYGYVTSGGDVDLTGVIRTMLIILCAAAALVFGIVWLSSMWKGISEVKNNKPFVAYLEERYNTEVLPDESRAIKRSAKNFWRVFFASLFFLLSISIDFHYIMPTFAFGICAYFAFSCAARYVENIKKAKYTSLAFAAVMLLQYIFMWNYCAHLGSMLFPYEHPSFIKLYVPFALLSVGGCVLLIKIFAYSEKTMVHLLEDCVGYREYTDLRRQEIDDERREFLARKTSKLCKMCRVFAVLLTLCTLSVPWFSLAWAVQSILCFIVIMFAYSAMCDVFAEAEKVL